MGMNEAMWTMDKEEDFISIISNLRRNNIQGNQMQSWATVTCFLNISPGHYQLLSNLAGETTTAYILQMILRAADGLACISKFPFCMASESKALWCFIEMKYKWRTLRFELYLSMSFQSWWGGMCHIRGGGLQFFVYMWDCYSGV